jgi:hypothetical protein
MKWYGFHINESSQLASAFVMIAFFYFASDANASCDCGSTDTNAPCTSKTLTVSAAGTRAVSFTWNFSSDDNPAACGRFANGDYWVAPVQGGAAVRIDSVSAAGSGTLSLDADPRVESLGLLSSTKTYGNYAAAENILPALPKTFTVATSLVAATQRDEASSGKCGTSGIVGNCADAYNVVTVLDSVPVLNGSDTLRPSISDGQKSLVRFTSIDLSRLPNVSFLTGTSDAGFDVIRQRWSHSIEVFSLWTLDGKYFSEGGRAFRASNFVGDYAGAVAGIWHNDLMTLFSDDTPVSNSAKRAALAAMLTYGKDLYFGVYGSAGRVRNWGAGAGQWLGRFPAAVFFAAMSTDPRYENDLAATSQDLLGFLDGRGPHELDQVNQGETGPVWGDFPDSMTALDIGAYWAEMLKAQCFEGATGTCVLSAGKRTSRDPYRYIDGPPLQPGGGYMYISIGPQRSLVATMFLMPRICSIVNYDPLVAYVDRVHSAGVIATPDPCAAPDPRESPTTCDPYRGTGCVYYRSTWGPDPANPSQCIKNGTGRFPARHGVKAKYYYTSTQVESAWTQIRGQSKNCLRANAQIEISAPEAPANVLVN